MSARGHDGNGTAPAPAETARQALAGRVERREAVVGVLGLGYVGLPLAVEVARSGFRVLGFDISERVVAGATGRAPAGKDREASRRTRLHQRERRERQRDHVQDPAANPRAEANEPAPVAEERSEGTHRPAQ